MIDLRKHLARLAQYSLLRGGFDARLVVVSSDGYDVDTGQRATSTVSHVVRVAFTHYHRREIDGVQIMRDDTRIYMRAPVGVVPKAGDRVEGYGQTREIVSVRAVLGSPDTVPVYTVQARA